MAIKIEGEDAVLQVHAAISEIRSSMAAIRF